MKRSGKEGQIRPEGYAYGSPCPSATLKRKLNINQSARTVMTTYKYLSESHGCQEL